MGSVFRDQQFQEFFLPICLFHPTRLLESLEYIRLELGLSLVHLCLPTYTKLIDLDLGIKLPGSLIPKSKIDLGL